MVDLLGNGFWKFLGIRPPISDNHHLILPFSLRSTFFEDFIWRFLFCIFGCSEMISQKQSTPGLTPGTPENRREVWRMISVKEGERLSCWHTAGAHVAQGFGPVSSKGARKMKEAQAWTRGNGVEETGEIWGGFRLNFFVGKNPCEVLGNKMVHFASNSLERHFTGVLFVIEPTSWWFKVTFLTLSRG